MEDLLKAIEKGAKEIILRKDLVILAGTIFTEAPSFTKRLGPGHYSATIGLSKDSFGTIGYFIDTKAKQDSQRLLDEWFLVI